MTRQSPSPVRALCVALSLLALPATVSCSEARLDTLQLPAGFSIEIWAEELPGARSLSLGPDGLVFVGSRRTGTVWAVRDSDGNGTADESWTLAKGLDMPNGVAFRDGSLFVAETSRVSRFDDIADRLDEPSQAIVVRDTFPSEKHHGWKFIAFGPDGYLYVPVGAPCNICDPDDDIFASITRMRADGSDFEVFARGVRNSVGFDWHPVTGELWFTDNGRDMLGDDLPPDELNRAPGAGLHFGFPHCHAGRIEDPEFGIRGGCSETIAPEQELGPHVAALGMRFYKGDAFPTQYRHQIFLAEHGSWNRSVPIGYQVSLVRIEESKAVSYEPFVEGWLQDGVPWGRPVDLLELPDGSLLVSDDLGGRIFRIRYDGSAGP